MLAYIIGRNRVVIGKVSLKDWEKYHWYLSGSQLYRMYPDQMVRVVRTRYGHPIKDEECMTWHENALIPYHPRGHHVLNEVGELVPDLQFYKLDRQLSDIREHMLMVPGRKKVHLGDIVAKHRGLFRDVRPWIPLLIGAVVFLWVWLR